MITTEINFASFEAIYRIAFRIWLSMFFLMLFKWEKRKTTNGHQSAILKRKTMKLATIHLDANCNNCANFENLFFNSF